MLQKKPKLGDLVFMGNFTTFVSIRKNSPLIVVDDYAKDHDFRYYVRVLTPAGCTAIIRWIYLVKEPFDEAIPAGSEKNSTQLLLGFMDNY